MLELEIVATKELYSRNGYKAIACTPTAFNMPQGLELNKYGDFTLLGENLNMIQIGVPIKVKIAPNLHSKYSCSYSLMGLSGAEVEDGELKLTPELSFQLLCQFMVADQARNVLKAEPNFIKKVLDGEEATLSPKNMKNVGDIRLKDYIEKVKSVCGIIPFMSACFEWGITKPADVDKICKRYDTVDDFKADMSINPYKVLSVVCEAPFRKMDDLILGRDESFRESAIRAEYCVIDYLRQNEQDGDTRIDLDILLSCLEDDYPELLPKIAEAVKTNPYIYYDPKSGYCSLKSTYEHEVTIAKAILSRTALPMGFDADTTKYQTIENLTLTNQQMAFLEAVRTQSVCMLVGPAGTGKTSTTKAVIRMLEDNHKTYTLLAPTGIAAKVLRQSTGREASTIHRAIYREAEFGEYVLIDEMSMVGVEVLSWVCERLNDHNKLVFVCDNAQLASIAAGNIVQDILDSGVVTTVCLDKVFRYGIGGIDTIATDTRNGEYADRTIEYTDYQFVTNGKANTVVDLYVELLKTYNKNDILVLSPFNKGPLGSHYINALIQQKINPSPETNATREKPNVTFKVGDRVINKVNNYSMEAYHYGDTDQLEAEGTVAVMNGDLGVVRYVEEIYKMDENGREDKNRLEDVYTYVEFDNGIAKYDQAALKNLLLGYCISIHKSQGSQAKAVIVIADASHRNLLSRNLLYVAYTRAQERLVEVSSKEVIKRALEVIEQEERETWLCDLLKSS